MSKEMEKLIKLFEDMATLSQGENPTGDIHAYIAKHHDTLSYDEKQIIKSFDLIRSNVRGRALKQGHANGVAYVLDEMNSLKDRF